MESEVSRGKGENMGTARGRERVNSMGRGIYGEMRCPLSCTSLATFFLN